jgi:hypothetical protein
MPQPNVIIARSLRLPQSLDDELRVAAFQTRQSQNAILCEALQLYLTIYRTTTHPDSEAVE